MKHLRQLIIGFLAAMLSTAIILGSLSISLAEGGLPLKLASSPIPETVSPPAVVLQDFFPTPTASLTLEQVSPPENCPPPTGWFVVVVQLGDTLESLAQAYSTSPETLAQGNCLVASSLLPGTFLYIPPAPSPTVPPTPTSTPKAPSAKTQEDKSCGAPSGWVLYTVRAGDSLSRIARLVGASVTELQKANCMGSSTIIHTGDRLYVPALPSVPVNIPKSTKAPKATKMPELPAIPPIIEPIITLTEPPPGPNPPPG